MNGIEVGTSEMNFPLILDVPRCRIQPKQENQVYNSIVQGCKRESRRRLARKRQSFCLPQETKPCRLDNGCINIEDLLTS
jgi:hypothetical protein